MFTWWHRTAMRRMTRAAGRPRLAVERLDERVTPAALMAAGAAVGSPPVITVYDAATAQQTFTITAFDPSFTGGVSVAVGDVNGDGTPDVIAGAGAGGGPVVKVFSGVDGSVLNVYTVGDADSRAGVTVAAADFNADGRADLVVGTVRGGAPLVQVLSGADGSVLHEFTPFAGASAPSVAAGDVNGDGTPDVVAGSGAGGAPRVVVYDGATEAVLSSFFAFEQSFVGGVSVSAGDLDGDGTADIVAAAGTGGGPRVQTYSGGTGAVLLNFFAYDGGRRGGVTATAADADANGSLDIVTRDGSGQTAGVAAFDGKTGTALTAPGFAAPPAAATYDTTAPTASITSSAPATTKASPVPFTVAFSEAVNGFSAGGLAATNGTVGDFTRVDAKTYTFTVTPAAAGAVVVTLSAGAASDAAGNGTAAASVTRTYSTSAPAVTATALTTNDATPTLTGTVDDPAAAVSVTAGGQTAAATVSGTTWTATLPAALAAGTYDIAVTATDAAGRTGTASLAGGLTVDLTPPAVSVSSTASEPTNASPIPYLVTFSEAVTGFTAADLTVTNGTVAAVSSTDDKTYTVTVTPTAQGAVSVSVAAGVASDAAGNGNAASNTSTRTYDSAAPAVTATALTTNDTTPTLTGTVDPSALSVSVAVGGQTVAATVSGTTWTATVPTALAEGTYPVAVTAADAAGNVGTAPAVNLVVDLTPPTAAVTSPANLTNTDLIPFTVTFSEAVAAPTAADLTVTNGTASQVVANSPSVYTVYVTPAADGAVTLTVAAGKAKDLAGNATTAAAGKTVTSDRTAPTATVTAAANPTTANPIPFTVTFSEAVTGFTAQDVVVTNGAVLAVTPVNATTYTVTVVPAAAGAVSVALPSGAAADAAGNGSTAAAPTAVTFNGAAVGAGVTTTAAAVTNAAAIPVTVTFTADVTGFAAGSLAVTNGAVGNFVAVDGKTYTFTVTPTADGAVTVTVPAGVASGGTGTPSSGASLTVTSDRTAPTATVTAAASTGLAPITFTVTFDEAVTGLTPAALSATNGTVGIVTAVDAKTYRVVVTPAGARAAVTLTVPAGATADPAGNPTAAAVTASATPTPVVDSAGLTADIPAFTGAGVTTQADGLKIKDVTTGTGAAVTAGQSVTVEYTLWLTDGTKVQTSVGNGGPYTFSLSGVIQGWMEGIVGMQPGGIRDLYVPAALGYGSNAQSGIPANSDLVFEVKLISAS